MNIEKRDYKLAVAVEYVVYFLFSCVHVNWGEMCY